MSETILRRRIPIEIEEVKAGSTYRARITKDGKMSTFIMDMALDKALSTSETKTYRYNIREDMGHIVLVLSDSSQLPALMTVSPENELEGEINRVMKERIKQKLETDDKTLWNFIRGHFRKPKIQISYEMMDATEHLRTE